VKCRIVPAMANVLVANASVDAASKANFAILVLWFFFQFLFSFTYFNNQLSANSRLPSSDLL
jgi:hypothetical protein